MKAVICTKYGDPEVLELKEIEKPVPGDNEILVRVHASSVTSGVVLIRRGKHPDSSFFSVVIRLFFGLSKPRKPILGYEFSGDVEALGANVKLFKIGDIVFGTTTGLKQGAYAEYVCIPEKWKSGVVARKPENLSYEASAAVPIGAMTALYLLKKANIQAGQKVLVYGASGSVGTYAVQLAKYWGADVTAVTSSGNHEMVRLLGASRTIDYKIDDFTENGEKYDVIFDAVGKLAKSHCALSLKKRGLFLSTNSPTKENTESLVSLKELIEKGNLKPVIDNIYALEEIREAHRYVDRGHKRGNVIIKI